MRRRIVLLVGVLGLLVLPGLGGAASPEVSWEIDPGDGAGGAPESQTAAAGPIQGSAVNGPPGVVSTSATSADFGALSASTTTTVDAGNQTGASFCLMPHCSEAEARWADELTFRAPGVVPNGTVGSFTAELAVSGALAATLSSSWGFVSVGSLYDLFVDVDFVTRDRIASSCTAIPIPGMACIPVTQQIYSPESGPVQTIYEDPFQTFAIGPYDFTWGQPFDIEVEIRVDAILDAGGQTAGTSSAVADLGDTVEWVRVVALFDGPEGSGNSIPLGSATVFPASGRDWLKTVAVPEPTTAVQTAAAAAALWLAGLYRRRELRRG